MKKKKEQTKFLFLGRKWKVSSYCTSLYIQSSFLFIFTRHQTNNRTTYAVFLQESRLNYLNSDDVIMAADPLPPVITCHFFGTPSPPPGDDVICEQSLIELAGFKKGELIVKIVVFEQNSTLIFTE